MNFQVFNSVPRRDPTGLSHLRVCNKNWVVFVTCVWSLASDRPKKMLRAGVICKKITLGSHSWGMRTTKDGCINDADYPVHYRKGNTRTQCPYYSRWNSVRERCYSGKWLAKHPTYAGCELFEGWRRFSIFRKWMEVQDWVGKELDKDLLGNGKLYHPDTCVFVPKMVNCFVLNSLKSRGDLPCGVTQTGKAFWARGWVGGVRVDLGRHPTPEAAYSAWYYSKVEYGLTLVKQQTCVRVGGALWDYLLRLPRPTSCHRSSVA